MTHLNAIFRGESSSTGIIGQRTELQVKVRSITTVDRSPAADSGLLSNQADWLGLIWLWCPSLNFVAYSLDSSGSGAPRIAPQSAPQLTHCGFSGRCPNF